MLTFFAKNKTRKRKNETGHLFSLSKVLAHSSPSLANLLAAIRRTGSITEASAGKLRKSSSSYTKSVVSVVAMPEDRR